jgi:hypothetical protein
MPDDSASEQLALVLGRGGTGADAVRPNDRVEHVSRILTKLSVPNRAAAAAAAHHLGLTHAETAV